MEKTTMTITAMHSTCGVSARARAGVFIAPTAWTPQGTGLSIAGSIRPTVGASDLDAPAVVSTNDVAYLRTGEPPA